MTEGAIEELKSATVLRLEPGDKVVLRFHHALTDDEVGRLNEEASAAFGLPPGRVIVMDGGADLAVLRQGPATPPAPVFVQLRNALDKPIAIDRTKVLSIEALGSTRAAANVQAAMNGEPDITVEYCNVYLAMLDQPLVVRGTEEEVVAAVEGGSTYDPTAPGEREAFARWMSHPRVSADLDRLAEARAIAASQAEDQRIWFPDVTPEEEYLQHALRELTEAIEGKSGEECARAALGEAAP